MTKNETITTGRQRPSGMRTFAAIFLAMHIPLFVYPILRLADWLDASLAMTLLVLIPVASSQVISRWLLRDVKSAFGRMLRISADFVLGMSPISLMCLLIFEVLVALGLTKRLEAAQFVLAATAAISVIGLLLAVFPKVKTISFESELLDSPLRFVQITDVHIGSRSSRFLDNLVARIKNLDPEFLCITGDFIDASGVSEKELIALKELDCPVYFSTGNHERYEDLDGILERLRALGVKVLRSEAIHHRTDVQVFGVDDKDDAGQVERELKNIRLDDAAFGILMYHRPRGFEAAEQAGVDLMISGHTHNGQIFPFNLIVNRIFDRVVGMYQLGKSRLYVSQGTGTWGPIMRVGTRAEITLFEIAATDAV